MSTPSPRGCTFSWFFLVIGVAIVLTLLSILFLLLSGFGIIPLVWAGIVVGILTAITAGVGLVLTYGQLHFAAPQHHRILQPIVVTLPFGSRRPLSRRTLLRLLAGVIGVVLIEGIIIVYQFFHQRSEQLRDATHSKSGTPNSSHVPPTSSPEETVVPPLNTAGAMFGSDPEHTRYNSQERILSSSNVSMLTLAWQPFSTRGDIQSSATVANNIIYFGSFDGVFYAVDATKGTQLWQHQTNDFILSTPAVVENTVYFGSRDKTLYALDALQGTVKWKQPTHGYIVSSPTIVNQSVYITSFDGKVYALDTKTGIVKWDVSVGGDRYFSSPAVSGSIIYVASTDTKVYALDSNSGGQLWASPSLGAFTSSPLVVNNLVYVYSHSGIVYALDAETGQTIVWMFSDHGNRDLAKEGGDNITFDSSPAFAHDTIYFGSNDGYLYALDAKKGTQRWTTPLVTKGSIHSSPTVANAVVYVGSNDGRLYAVDEETGKLLWSYLIPIGSADHNLLLASPTVSHGSVYIGSTNHQLYAFRLPNS